MSGPSGWVKIHGNGRSATYPIRTGTKLNFENVEVSCVLDADGDEVLGGTWGDTTVSSPFPTGTAPEKNFDTLYELVERIVKKVGA